MADPLPLHSFVKYEYYDGYRMVPRLAVICDGKLWRVRIEQDTWGKKGQVIELSAHDLDLEEFKFVGHGGNVTKTKRGDNVKWLLTDVIAAISEMSWKLVDPLARKQTSGGGVEISIPWEKAPENKGK